MRQIELKDKRYKLDMPKLRWRLSKRENWYAEAGPLLLVVVPAPHNEPGWQLVAKDNRRGGWLTLGGPYPDIDTAKADGYPAIERLASPDATLPEYAPSVAVEEFTHARRIEL